MKIDAVHYRRPSSKALRAAETLKGDWLAAPPQSRFERVSIKLQRHKTDTQIAFVAWLKTHVCLTPMAPRDKRAGENED